MQLGLTYLAATTAGLAMNYSSVLGASSNESLKIVAADGGPDHEFGCAVAIADGIIVVGAPGDGQQGVSSGSAYLYLAASGTQIAKLLPSDGVAGDRFGASVAIDGGIVAVGAPGHDHAGADSGAAYLFDASTGVQLFKIAPDDAETGDEFGNSIDADGGRVAVGAWRADEFGNGSGAAYLFDVSTGNQVDKLLPDAGANFQTFGVSIAIDDGVVAVGARTYFVPGDGFTFASVHLFDASTGVLADVLRADIENFNGDQGGGFGESIDIHSGQVVVGAPNRSVFFDHSGAAYVFDADTGDQLHFIVPVDGHDRDHFGNSVSIESGVLAIGAEQDGDSGWVAGSAYLFDAVSGVQQGKLLASDGAAFDYFGTSIAIGADVIAVGAVGDEDNGANSGSVYVFGEAAGGCPADLVEPFGQLDFSDVVAFLEMFSASDPAADMAEPFGQLDFSDVIAFLTAFGAGCP